MRKLLLASAAMLGATYGVASAQQPQPAAASMMMQPSQGQFALPWQQGPTVNNNNNAYGNPSSYVGASAYGKNAVPSPGTVVIRLNGRIEVDYVASWSTNHSVGGFKTNANNLSSYLRLYPGVDGVATNGLRYGAAAEIRQNYPGSTAQPTPSLNPAPSPSTYDSGETLFVRRAFTYLAHDNFGILRMGTTDGLIGLFDPAIFSGAGWDGGHGALNGAGPQGYGVTGAFAVPYVLSQAGAEYSNAKIVYLTPQFFGFDFGVQYAPSMGNSASSCNAANSALGGVQNCNATTTGNDPIRWYNQVGVGARWQGVFGPVSTGLYVVYQYAGRENLNVALVNPGRGLAGTRYQNLSFVTAAGYVLWNSPVGQFTAALTYQGGDTNGQLILKPSGGATHNQFVGGISYRNGPLSIGTQFNLVDSQGSAALTAISQRHEFAFAVGGNYVLAPGFNLYAEYQYAHRHQGGFDFTANGLGAGATGAAGTATWRPGLTRDGHGQAIIVGTAVSW